MSQVTCPDGHVNRAGAKFCHTCGKPLPPPPAAAYPEPTQLAGSAPPFIPPAAHPDATQLVGSEPPFAAEPAQPGAPPAWDNAYQQPPYSDYQQGYQPDYQQGYQADYPQAAPMPPIGNKRRRGMWIGLIVLLVVLAGAAGLFLLLRDDEDEDGEETAVATTTPTAVITPTTTITPTATVSATIPVTATLPAVAPPAEAVTSTTNLLVNGDFSQSWDVGWERVLADGANGTQLVEVIDSEQGAAGRVVHINRSGNLSLSLQQTTAVDPAQMWLRAQVKLVGSVNAETGMEGIAALLLVYRGADVNAPPLGYSMWINGVRRDSSLFGQSPLPPIGPNVALHWLGDEWTSLDVDLRREVMDGIPAMNPDQVQHVTVILLGIGSETCSAAECALDVWATDVWVGQAP